MKCLQPLIKVLILVFWIAAIQPVHAGKSKKVQNTCRTDSSCIPVNPASPDGEEEIVGSSERSCLLSLQDSPAETEQSFSRPAHPKNKGRGRAKKSKTARKQNISAEDPVVRFRELEVPASAQEAHQALVAMFVEGHVTCGRVFVDTIKDVVDMEKEQQEQRFNPVPKPGRRPAELPENVSQQLLEKSKLYLSLLGEAIKNTTNKPIDTRSLTTLKIRGVGEIKAFLDFKEEYIRKLATLGNEAIRAFVSLHGRFPGSLDSFVEFFELFGEEEGKIPSAFLHRFTSMHKDKGRNELVIRTRDFWEWIQRKGWTELFSSISGLLSIKGIPPSGGPVLTELEAFMALFGEGENKIPSEYLSRFTSMHHGKGTTGLVNKTKDFWAWLKTKGWDDQVSSINGMLSAKGIPAPGDPVLTELESFMALFGESDDKIPSKYRSRFTSMQRNKGIRGLTSKTIIFWKWIQEKGWEDHASSISGLLNGQGIPERESMVLKELETFMALFGEGADKIPWEFRSCFTSMHFGKGIKGLTSKTTTFWKWIQEKGWEDHVSSISGLLNCQGIPERKSAALKELETFMALFGEGEDKIPWECRSCFTSMHCGKGIKGLTSKTTIFWQWMQEKSWESHVTAISGLLNKIGIPEPGSLNWDELETFMALFGEGEDKISLEFRSCFTSIQCGKGIKGLTSKTIIFWSWIQEKGLENHVSSISGLLSKQGIPEPESTPLNELETFIALFGEGENKIPLKYRSCFTSMQNGKGTKGLTSKATGFWKWVQEKGWEGYISSISGLLNGQGIPEGESTTLKELEVFLALFGEGENKIPSKYQTYFTSMNHCKRTKELVNRVQSFWGWVERDASLLREATRLNHLAGIPETSTLNKILDRLNPAEPCDDVDTVFLKLIALHIAARPKNQLPLSVVQSFIENEKTAGRGSGVIPRLANLVQRHGKHGVQAYQDIVDERDLPDVSKVVSLFQKAQTVEQARMAVTKILPQDGFRETTRYLAVCRTLSSAPDPGEWKRIKRYIKVLRQTIDKNYNDSDDEENECAVTPSSLTNSWFIQGEYIASLWRLPVKLRERFLQVNSVQSLLGVVRSITALKRLSRAGSSEKFQQQCEACLSTAAPMLSARDMVNLFQIHRTLRIPWYQQQRDFEGDFSQVSPDASGTGVLIKPTSGENGKSLWQPFVAAVVNGLYESNMSPVGQNATIILPGELEGMEFPAPQLTLNEQGISITNWTEEQYRLFADTLELPGFESDETAVSEPYVKRLRDQKRDAATENRNEPKNLSFRLIEQLLKSPVPLKRQTWNQLESQREQLPAAILQLLRKKRHQVYMPETLRDYVQSAGHVNEQAGFTTEETPDVDFLADFDITGNLLDDLLQQPILTADTLKLLHPLADDISAAQLTDIVARMDINLSWEERCPWMEKLAANAMPRNNPDSWGIEDWLGDDSLEVVPGLSADAPDSLSLVPVWGESEEIDEIFQD